MAKLVSLQLCVFICLSAVYGVNYMAGHKVVDNCKCGIKNIVTARIVGGEEASKNEFPWQAYMTYLKAPKCGGIIINNKYVLLAGHCFNEVSDHDNDFNKTFDAKEFEFILGMHEKTDYDRDSVLKKQLEKYIIHPKYNVTNLHNDIALAKLTTKIEFSLTIAPACLPINISQNYTEHPAIVTGWGAQRADGELSDVLKKATVYVKDNDYCRYFFKKNFDLEYLNDSMICAYDKYGDACQGDSGGALVATFKPHIYIAIGIVSNGAGCGIINIPGIYTKVSFFMDFIMANTKDAIWCKNT